MYCIFRDLSDFFVCFNIFEIFYFSVKNTEKIKIH